jgi:formylglycine-generating enzyme required for sulfatase activity
MIKQIFIFIAFIVSQSFGISQNIILAIPKNNIRYEMVYVPAGEISIDKVTEKIKLDPFYMGTHEVDYPTYFQFFQDENYSQNGEYDAITRPSPPYLDFTLGMGKEKGFPANSMQHFGAMMFCRWLYEKTGEFYRLPTEAEWQYACYIGETEKNNVNDVAWYASNSEDRYHKSGELKPNKLGIYDLLGNVSEWTLDQYWDDYPKAIFNNYNNPYLKTLKKHPHTIKGGSYKDEVQQLTCAARGGTDMVWNRRDPQIPKSTWWNTDAPFVGFRLVKPFKQPNKDEVKNFFIEYFKK